MLFEFEGKKILIDNRIKLVPEIAKIMEAFPKKGKDILTFIALMYDINSPYYDELPEERERLLRKDIFGENPPKELKDEIVLKCIEKVCHLTLTPELRYIEANKVRIEKAINVILQKEPNEDNIDEFLKDQKNLDSLFVLKKRMEETEQLAKQKTKTKKGGKQTSEFEDDDFSN